MIFEKRGMWKHALSSKKFATYEEAWNDWLTFNPEAEYVPEKVCEFCEQDPCECPEISPLEALWKLAEQTSSPTE